LGVGSRLKGVVPSLDIDRGHAADRTIEHFLNQGHRNILMVYEYDWDLRPSFQYWAQPGITFWSGIHEPEDFFSRTTDSSWKSFDAIFFRTDRIAIPVLGWLRDRGVRVPEDVEIISFDNYPFTEFTVPPISTWDIGFNRLGRRAQDCLARWMAGEGPAADYFESFQPDFVARKSHKGSL
jgi:DNA-binding LacI/PurR family transcriptional regulator